MLHPLRVTLIALAGALMSACAAAPPEPSPSPSPPIAGGWSVTGVNEETQAAADFAAARLSPAGLRVVKIEVAETQVVAGLNHRLTLKLSDGSRHQVVVWHRLDGTFGLSSDSNLP